MAFWHEPVKHNINVLIPPSTGKVGAVTRRIQEEPLLFTAYFMRYEGQDKARLWTRFPDDWIELHPRIPITGKSHPEVRNQVLALFPIVEAGGTDDQFIRKPYLTPKRPQKVEEIEHPTHQAKAIIVRHEEQRYEVTYRVYAPDGHYFPVSTPSIGIAGWEWRRARTQVHTLADDLQSAREIAIVELNEIVDKDSGIKRRDAGEAK